MTDYISELRDSLSESATDQQADKWWTLVELIESRIAHDIKRDKSLAENIRHLRATVSDVILARREGLNPNYSGARVAISAIEEKIRPRTGLDGWPVR